MEQKLECSGFVCVINEFAMYFIPHRPSGVKKQVRKEMLPPGSQGLPWLGHSLSFLRHPLTFMQSKALRYGQSFQTRLIGRDMIFLLGPEANQFVLSTAAKELHWREGYGSTPARLFGQALVVQDGEEHSHYRNIMTPAFRSSPMEEAVTSIADVVRQQLNLYTAHEQVEWYSVFKRLAFAVAGKILLGIDTEPTTPQLVQWFNQFSAGLFTPFPFSFPGTTFTAAMRARKNIFRYLVSVVQARRLRQDRGDVLGHLIAGQTPEGSPLSDEQIASQLLLLLFAGHDTTASLSTWLLYELGEQTDIRTRLQEDIPQSAKPISLAALRQSSFLEACIKEAERKYPPAPTGFRGVTQDLEYQEFVIPKGWTLVYSPLFTHHMPELYPNPERFDPDRMLPPRLEHKQKPYGLVGFGGGPRKCIGEHLAQVELKVIFTILCQEYHWEVFPGQDVRPEFIPSMHPKRGLYGRVLRIT